jgi:hypothetical protein
LTAHCNNVLWHRRCGHLNVQSLEAQHDHVTTVFRRFRRYRAFLNCFLRLLPFAQS